MVPRVVAHGRRRTTDDPPRIGSVAEREYKNEVALTLSDNIDITGTADAADGESGRSDANVLAESSEVLLDNGTHGVDFDPSGSEEWAERESRNQLKRVAGLGELQDITEVEYRKVRLERVVLVGVWSSAVTTQAKAEESLRELAALAQTAGAEVCDGLLQHRSRPDAATYVGSGKAKEIADIVAREEADTIVVDDDLPPSQRRGLEDAAKVKVVDRTAVILDIFAQHATSREGKAQVELAQLEYMLPRLRGWGGSLSRQAGGQAAGQNGGIGSRSGRDADRNGPSRDSYAHRTVEEADRADGPGPRGQARVAPQIRSAHHRRGRLHQCGQVVVDEPLDGIGRAGGERVVRHA